MNVVVSPEGYDTLRDLCPLGLIQGVWVRALFAQYG